MRFLSIYKARETNAPPSAEHIAAMTALIEESVKRGELLSTEGCLPTSLGARVRLADGSVTVTDGPFAEAKEVVGGFAILEAPSMDAAIELTKRFLRIHGTEWDIECEVRQIDGPEFSAEANR